MSRKQRTVATFAVTIQIPDGSNLALAQQYIREAISAWAAMANRSTGFTGIKDDWFTVALTKKVTTYGNN